MTPTEAFRVERKIPLALVWVIVVTLLAQTSGALIWATSMTARIGVIESTLASRTPLVDRLLQTERDHDLLRKETEGRLSRIESKLDQLLNGAR